MYPYLFVSAVIPNTRTRSCGLTRRLKMSSPPKRHAITWVVSLPRSFLVLQPTRPSLYPMFSFTNWMSTTKMEKSQAEDYLTSLLGKTLRVTTNDTRMFLGQFKCTDSVRLLPLPLIHPIPLSLHPDPNPYSNSNSILISGPQHNPLLDLRIPSPSSTKGHTGRSNSNNRCDIPLSRTCSSSWGTHCEN